MDNCKLQLHRIVNIKKQTSQKPREMFRKTVVFPKYVKIYFNFIFGNLYMCVLFHNLIYFVNYLFCNIKNICLKIKEGNNHITEIYLLNSNFGKLRYKK